MNILNKHFEYTFEWTLGMKFGNKKPNIMMSNEQKEWTFSDRNDLERLLWRRLNVYVITPVLAQLGNYIVDQTNTKSWCLYLS